MVKAINRLFKMQIDAEVAKQLLMALRSRDYWYLENFIQRLIKDFLSRHPRIANIVYKTKVCKPITKTVKKFTKRVFKTQDPVFQRYEIQLIRGQARKSAGWMPWH